MGLNHIRAAGAAIIVASFLAASGQKPPAARTDKFQESFHGQDLVDPYHWLEDSTSSETRAWIDAENVYAHTLLNAQPVRKDISSRLTVMMHHDQIGAPELRNGFYYFSNGAPRRVSGPSIAAS